MPSSLSSLLPAPNGCHRLLLAISRLIVFNIYLHLPFPSHPPPTLLLQQLPHQCTSPGGTQQNRSSQARAPSLGGTRQAPPPGGRSHGSRGHPGPAPAGTLRPPSRPSPTDSGNPKGGKEGGNQTHTKRRSGEGGWGQRDTASLGWGLEGLGREGRLGEQKEEEEKWRKMNRTSS